MLISISLGTVGAAQARWLSKHFSGFALAVRFGQHSGVSECQWGTLPASSMPGFDYSFGCQGLSKGLRRGRTTRQGGFPPLGVDVGPLQPTSCQGYLLEPPLGAELLSRDGEGDTTFRQNAVVQSSVAHTFHGGVQKRFGSFICLLCTDKQGTSSCRLIRHV